MKALLTARFDKIGESLWFSLNVGLVHHFFYCQHGSQASKECFKQVEKIFWWPYKEIVTAVLGKVQDVVEAIEKKSIWRGETVWKKLPQCGIFHGLSIIFTTWWDFQLKGARIHISRNPKTSQNTWRKGGFFFRKTRRWRKFFLRKTWRNHLDYPEVKADLFLKGTLRETPRLPEGECKSYLRNTRRKYIDHPKAKEDIALGNTRWKHLDYLKVKEDFSEGNLMELPNLSK